MYVLNTLRKDKWRGKDLNSTTGLNSNYILGKNSLMEDTCLFVGSLTLLFWTPYAACSGSQSRNRHDIRTVADVPRDSSLVRHLM